MRKVSARSTGQSNILACQCSHTLSVDPGNSKTLNKNFDDRLGQRIMCFESFCRFGKFWAGGVPGGPIEDPIGDPIDQDKITPHVGVWRWC